MIFPVEGKHFPGGFRWQTMTFQQNRFMGRTLGGIGVTAVYGTQRVCAHIPDSGTVGGDGVPDAGQLRHQRRQAGKGPPGAGQHDDPAPDGIGNGLPGAGEIWLWELSRVPSRSRATRRIGVEGDIVSPLI